MGNVWLEFKDVSIVDTTNSFFNSPAIIEPVDTII
jgi:hypothetical protein